MREYFDNRMRILCLCFFIHYLLEGVIRDLNEHCQVVVSLWKFWCTEYLLHNFAFIAAVV